MGGGHIERVELFAVRGLRSLGVETGHPMRSRFGFGGIPCAAPGYALLTAATRLFIMDDVVRSWSNDARRLARSSDFWVTTEDCAQAASDAAASETASSRMNFPAARGRDQRPLQVEYGLL